MKNHLLFFISIFIHLSHIHAQPGFNKTVDVGYPRNDIWDMIVVNDTIIGYGFGFKDSTYTEQGLILTKFDSSGNLIKSNFIADSLGSLSINSHWGKIISTFDGGYAMTTAVGGSSNSVLLIKTDSELEVEFVKEYPDTVYLTHYWYRLIEINDGYMLYGIVQLNNLAQVSFLRKVNKQGNTEWINYYGDGLTSEIFFEGHQYNDSLFVFGGVKAGESFDLSKGFVKFINMEGEVTSSWLSEPNPEVGFIRRINVLDNGDILIFGQYLYEYNGSFSTVQPALTRMTPTFEKKWVKHFGRIAKGEERIQFLDMASLSNEEWIGAGQGLVDMNGEDINSGWLMKFNTEGDSIWSRYDFPIDLPMENLEDDTFFGGVGVLSSGSIIAGGTVSTWSQQSIWLVKVTSDGCMEMIDCGLVPTKEREEHESKLAIYPNPATHKVTLEWKTENPKAANVLLYDVQGRLLKKERASQWEQQIFLDVSNLPNGIYFVEVFNDTGHIGREKILIQKE